VSIHGDYDPHPAEGVKEPLTRVIKDFRFILLKKLRPSPLAGTAGETTILRCLETGNQVENECFAR